jgi:hypothetical protein
LYRFQVQIIFGHQAAAYGTNWAVPGGGGQPGEEEADFIGDICKCRAEVLQLLLIDGIY